MIAQTLRVPHNLYRRYQAVIESALAAFGFALVVTLTLHSLAAYPSSWITVIGTAVALIGIRWQGIAFSIGVLAITYPLSLINLYLAVLFLAVSILGHRFFVHYIGATVLVLGTPLLGEFHLHWLVPILVGLWWGGATGAWVGAIACFWGKLVGGLAGYNIDWLILAGKAIDASNLADRFADANSLQTLLLLVEPFAAESSDVMLYNLLQIVGWAMAAGLVGSLTQQRWVKYRVPWSIFLVTTAGGTIMMLAHLSLPLILPSGTTAEAIAVVQNPIAPLFSLLTVIIVGTLVYSIRERLDLPVAPRKAKKRRRVVVKKQVGQPTPAGQKGRQKMVQPLNAAPKPTRQPVRVPDYSELPEWEPPKDESGLIMLEID